MPSSPLTVSTDEAVCIELPEPVAVDMLEPVVGDDIPEALRRVTGG